jgi:peroxiredoxin
MPELNKLVEKYKDNPAIVFLGMAEDNEEEIKEFLKKKEFNYNLVGKAGKFSRGTMGITAWPTSMVVDKNGVVQISLTGTDEMELVKLDKKIEELSR